LASWLREAGGATLWSFLGLAAAAFAGIVGVYGMIGYGLSFGKAGNWCNSPFQLYRDAAIIGLVVVAAHLPGLWILRRRLRSVPGRLGAVVTFGPIVFSAGSVLMAAAGHALRCLPGAAPPFVSAMRSLNDAGSLGIGVAPVLLAFAGFAAAAIGARLDDTPATR